VYSALPKHHYDDSAENTEFRGSALHRKRIKKKSKKDQQMLNIGLAVFSECEAKILRYAAVSAEKLLDNC
jgi:hypothetical protein